MTTHSFGSRGLSLGSLVSRGALGASLAFVTALGCAPPATAPPPPATAKDANHAVLEGDLGQVQSALRAQEKSSDAITDAAMDEDLDKREKDALKALSFALGKTPAFPGQPAPEASSAIVKALRAAKITTRLEAVLDQDGKPVNDDFLQVKDSFTDRVQVLSRKIAEQKATPAEMREVQAGAKHAMKLNDLRMQVMHVSQATMLSNTYLQSQALTTMVSIAEMVRMRKMMSMETSDEDYARVERILARQHRTEAIAASTMGMLAAYQAVLSGSGDPKALDVIAEETIKAFPIKATATREEAKAYVAGLDANVAQQKAKYEAMLRKTYGDARYERQMKAGIDATFAHAAAASSQKSIGEMSRDTDAKYRQDLAKCARGEAIDPGSLVGPGKCKEMRTRVAIARSSGRTGSEEQLVAGVLSDVQNGIGIAQAAANGDLGGALEGAAGMFPADGTIGSSLNGLAALAKGDPKGALDAALNLVPGGGLIKDGLSFASGLLFGKKK